MRSIHQLPLVCALAGDQTCNLVMCPDWELDPRPFGVWEDAPTDWAIGQDRVDFHLFNENKFTYKFTWAVETHVIQGSTVFPKQVIGIINLKQFLFCFSSHNICNRFKEIKFVFYRNYKLLSLALHSNSLQ